ALFLAPLYHHVRGVLGRIRNHVMNLHYHHQIGNSVCMPFQYMDLTLKQCQNYCYKNDDCRKNEICSTTHQCINPCSFDPCRENEACYVNEHTIQCQLITYREHNFTSNIQNADDNFRNYMNNYRGELSLDSQRNVNRSEDDRIEKDVNRSMCTENLNCDGGKECKNNKCICPEDKRIEENGICYNCTDQNNCNSDEICSNNVCQHICANFMCFQQQIKTCESSPENSKQCTCKSGYIGDPTDHCSTGHPCKLDKDCSYTEQCYVLNNAPLQCINVCKCVNCGHKKCEIVKNHTSMCTCGSGFFSNGTACLPNSLYAQQLRSSQCRELRNPYPAKKVSCDQGCNETSVVILSSEVSTDLEITSIDYRMNLISVFLGEQMCLDTEYYDPDFGKCRSKCQRDDDCLLDESFAIVTSMVCNLDSHMMLRK
ncbi:hypothetical protein PV325_007268, partial [Microctonus aethiopoides]